MWSNSASSVAEQTSWSDVGAYCAFSADGLNDGGVMVMSDPAEGLRKFGEMVAKLKSISDIRPEVVAKYKLPHSIKRPTSIMVKNLVRGLSEEF